MKLKRKLKQLQRNFARYFNPTKAPNKTNSRLSSAFWIHLFLSVHLDFWASKVWWQNVLQKCRFEQQRASWKTSSCCFKGKALGHHFKFIAFPAIESTSTKTSWGFFLSLSLSISISLSKNFCFAWLQLDKIQEDLSEPAKNWNSSWKVLKVPTYLLLGALELAKLFALW